MTFIPPSGRISTESFDETNLSGWSLQDPRLQNVIGGNLRLIPDTGVEQFDGVQFPPLQWDEVEWFDQFSEGITTRWTYTGSGPSWDPDTRYLLIDQSTGVEHFQQDSTGETFFDTVSNSNGYAIDIRVLASRAATGGTDTGAYMIMDDGFHRLKVNFRRDRVAVHSWDSGVWAYQDRMSPPIHLNEYSHVFRFAMKDSFLNIMTDEGLVMGGFMPDTGVSNSVAKTLLIGTLGGVDAALQVDWVKQYHHDGTDIYPDVPLVSPPLYTTSFVGATLPIHAPGRKCYGWNKAEIDLDGDTGGGTSRLVVDYMSSATSGWVNHSTTTLTTVPRQTVSLSGIPVESDATDALRFKIEQKSLAGATIPLSASQLMVTETEPGTGECLSIYPTYGPAYGSSIAIDLKPAWVPEHQFPISSNWPAITGTRLLMHFDETGLAPQDSSGNAHHGTVPGGAATSTIKGASGWFGYGLHVVGGNGQVDLPAHADFAYNQDVTISFFTKSFMSGTGNIWEHKSGSRGVTIMNNDSGYLEVQVTDGSSTGEHIHTGALIGDNEWSMVWVKLLQGSGKIRTRVTDSDWEESTGFGSIDYYTGLTATQANLFNGCWGTFDEMVFLAGSRVESTWDDLHDRETSRTPVTTSTVFVDGEEVTGERVHWYWPTRVYVNLPPHAAGDVPIWIDHEGDILDADSAYRYLPAYKIDVEDQLENAQACTTKSPFRIGHTVPDGSVNLALVKVPELSVESHMSRLGLEHLEAANLATHQQGYFSLDTPDTGTAGVDLFAGGVDTSDILISTRSVTRRDYSQGRPLFYKYLLGRGRYYYYSPDAFSLDDSEGIRRSIRIEDQDGSLVDINTFPWDVDISLVDYYGANLPQNTFSVVLHTETVDTFGKTYFVVFDASDAMNLWGLVPGHREIINAVPGFSRDPALDGLFQYDIGLDGSGAYDLRVTR